MPSLEHRLQILSSLDWETVEATLEAALPYALPEEVSAFSHLLAEAERWQSATLLLRHYDHLDSSVRGKLGNLPLDILTRAMRVIAEEGGKSQVTAMLAAIADMKLPGLAHLASERLSSHDPEIRAAAAEAILNIARTCDSMDPGSFRRLDHALVPAIRNYHHHRSEEVLLAVSLQLPHAGRELKAVLADPEEPALMPLRSLIRKSRDEQLQRKLMSLLAARSVSAAIRQRLMDMRRGNDAEYFLGGSHLALVPVIRMEMRQVDRPVRCIPSPGCIRELSPQSQAGHARFLSSLKINEKVLAPRLADGAAFSSPLGRIMSLQHLLRRGTREADQQVIHFCFDEKEPTARMATRYLLTRGGRLPGELTTGLHKLRRSPHEGVRRLLAGTPVSDEEVSFDSAWELAIQGRVCSALLLARKALKHNREAVLESLRRRVLGGDRLHRITAILMARQLQLQRHTELELLASLSGEDPRVAATAVSALAEVDSPASANAITACLSHADPRVQANAVEAIDRRLPWKGAVDALIRASQPITRLMDAEGNRSRANALRTLMRVGVVEPKEVVQMLRDPRPLHRISGMWLVAKLRLTEVQEEVNRLTKPREPQPVRERAKVVVKRLGAMGTPRTALPISYSAKVL